MNKIKMMEWNVNQRAKKNGDIPEFVIEEIKKHSPDIIILTEFDNGSGYEKIKKFKNQFEDKYCVNSSDNKIVNDVLIMTKIDKFLVSGIEQPFDSDSNNEHPEYLKVKCMLKDTGKSMMIVGVRIKTLSNYYIYA